MPSLPGSPAVDWDLAFLLFSQGQTYPQIAATVGVKEPTLRQRASRHEWRRKLADARHTVSQDIQRRVESLSERGEIWQSKEATTVERVTDVLDSLPIPKKIKPLREYVELRACHGKHGRATFGLDSQQAAIQINIGRVGVASVSPIPDQDQVVDIPSDIAPPTE